MSLADNPTSRRRCWACSLVVALFGIVGLGFGALVRNQIVAVSVGLIFLLVLQNIVPGIPGPQVRLPVPAGRRPPASIFTVVGSRDGQRRHAAVARGRRGPARSCGRFVPAILGAMFTLNRDIT